LEYLTAIWFYYGHLVHFVVIWYIFHSFGKFHPGKSGNPAFQLFMTVAGFDIDYF
jgi:hypothetical protein